MVSRRRIPNFSSAAYQSGYGEPWQIMHSHTLKLLGRLQQLHPFPLASVEDFMKSCLPPVTFNPQTELWENLARCVETGDICHFELEGEDPSLSFWVSLDTNFPVPHGTHQHLRLHKSNLHYEVLSEWVQKAFLIQDEITMSGDKLAEFFKVVKHPKWAVKVWPQIEPFIPTEVHDAGHTDSEPTGAKLHMMKSLIEVYGEEILTLLSKCLMLPGEFVLKAWVGTFLGLGRRP
jgi:hypothetical protein